MKFNWVFYTMSSEYDYISSTLPVTGSNQDLELKKGTQVTEQQIYSTLLMAESRARIC